MLFQDNIRQAKPEQNGFVIIPFLSEQEVVELNRRALRFLKGSHHINRHEPEDDFVFQYNNRRTEVTLRPPHPKAVAGSPCYIHKSIALQELLPLINPKKRFPISGKYKICIP